jgi:FtsP/CotA-like multicopper oxidase with cupredoxin domain
MRERLTRRAVLKGGAGLAAAPLFGCGRDIAEPGISRAGRLAETRMEGRVVLNAAQHEIMLPGRSGMTPAWLYGESGFPVLRARLGEPLHAMLLNGLNEHSSIHWHGVRIANPMDGVPYLTQMPVLAGENFSYRFTPPDPGTTIFHPHCNTVEQFGRGLAGVLIVEGDESEPFDDDVVCVLKDWRVDGEGRFLPLMTVDGAGGAGSFGALRTTNGFVAPEISVPAGANIRLRLVNLDLTRIGELGLEGAPAHVIAIDGNAVTPFPLETWRLGPAMRLDVSLRTPAAGQRMTLFDYFAAEPVTLATLVARGPSRRNDDFAVAPLVPAELAEPDLAAAKIHALRLSTAAAPSNYQDVPPILLPDGTTIDVLDSLCANPRTLWAIDGKAWPEREHANLPPPFARFGRGDSVVLDFVNESKQPHPMHLHGHTFKVLSASQLPRPEHRADTVLVMPDERVRVAFVADNPGKWMIHCHIVEHQDTGMMAWFEVA